MFYGNYSQNGNAAFCIIHFKLTAGYQKKPIFFVVFSVTLVSLW